MMPHPSGGTPRTLARALRAEWTKLRSVRSTGLALLATIALTLLITVLSATLSDSQQNDGPLTIDQFRFVHQSLAADGDVTARVVTQQNSGGWAKAGIMIKAGTASGSPYAALMVTPQHGVRLQGDAKTELAGSETGGPRWLRLTRTGQSVTGYESADGTSWRKVGTVTVEGLPAQAQAGLFVASPAQQDIKQMGADKTAVIPRPTTGKAVFDHIEVRAVAGQAAADWQNTDVTRPPPTRAEMSSTRGGIPFVAGAPGSTQQQGGVLTVTGSGDIGRVGMGGIMLDDADTVQLSLTGIQMGLIAVVGLGVLFMTSEYKSSTIRTTFAASPRRGQVLAAKAVVLGGTVFATGLVTSFAAFFLAQPLLRRSGYGPPAYPDPSLADPAVLRAVVGSALFLAVFALFSLGVGAILRRTAGAIIAIFALLIVLPSVIPNGSIGANTWINRATPIAGLAIQQTKNLPGTETVIGPWAGFAVLCGYAAVALGLAYWLLNRRDA